MEGVGHVERFSNLSLIIYLYSYFSYNPVGNSSEKNVKIVLSLYHIPDVTRYLTILLRQDFNSQQVKIQHKASVGVIVLDYIHFWSNRTGTHTQTI